MSNLTNRNDMLQKTNAYLSNINNAPTLNDRHLLFKKMIIMLVNQYISEIRYCKPFQNAILDKLDEIVNNNQGNIIEWAIDIRKQIISILNTPTIY